MAQSLMPDVVLRLMNNRVGSYSLGYARHSGLYPVRGLPTRMGTSLQAQVPIRIGEGQPLRIPLNRMTRLEETSHGD